MSDLIAIAYDDVATATQVREKVFDLQKEHLIAIEDIVVVERRQDGRIKLHQARNLVGAGALGGAAWGGLIGLIFFMPLLGMAIGAATGAAAGAASDIGVDDQFMRELGQHLKPGSAAVFMLVAEATPDRVIPELTKFGGRLLKTSLSAEAEQHLRDAAKSAREQGAPVGATAGR